MMIREGIRTKILPPNAMFIFRKPRAYIFRNLFRNGGHNSHEPSPKKIRTNSFKPNAKVIFWEHSVQCTHSGFLLEKKNEAITVTNHDQQNNQTTLSRPMETSCLEKQGIHIQDFC